MKNTTRAVINAFLVKQGLQSQQTGRLPQGFGYALESYLKQFAGCTGQTAEVAARLRQQIGINNRIIVASDSGAVRGSYAYANMVLREMANRLEGFMADYRVIAA